MRKMANARRLDDGCGAVDVTTTVPIGCMGMLAAVFYDLKPGSSTTKTYVSEHGSVWRNAATGHRPGYPLESDLGDLWDAWAHLEHYKPKTKPATVTRKPSPSLATCPYCHDDVQELTGTACAQCLARHHEECWAAHAACSSCGARARYGAVRVKGP